MTYTTAEYEKARRELERRRKDAEQKQQMRHDEAIAKCPELVKIEQEMAAAGLAAIKALGMGEDSAAYIKKLEKINLDAQKKRAELLKQNGFPEDYLKIKYTCPLCSDKGFKDGKMCRCQKLILRSMAYEKLCGHFPLDKCRFDNFDLRYYSDGSDGISDRERMRAVFEFCKNYADDFDRRSPSILMYGGTGLGKTHLSLAIAGQVIGKGYGVIYASAQNILNKLENEKFGRSERVGTEESLIDCDLLILDDLGAEFSTQFTTAAVYNIINSRRLSGKPTVISTNLSLKQIESAYTQRVASRILSEYTLLKFEGTDIRQIKTKQTY